MAKVILILEDAISDDGENGVNVSHNLASFNGQTITIAMIAVNLLTDMLGASFISACEAEAKNVNKNIENKAKVD
jgi:hypothetical protein